MKRIAENRYPHSATLFKFCKEALSLRADPSSKVIDQDVGAILSYDPADCSHWKKGKKNLRSLTTLKNLASYLQVDENLIIEIASGKIDLQEALFEFKGYGTTSGENKTSFKTEGILQLAENLVRESHQKTVPVCISSIYKIFKNIELLQDSNIDNATQVDSHHANQELQLIMRYKETKLRPYIKFLLSKELFFYLHKSGSNLLKDIREGDPANIDMQANTFAGALLVPTSLLHNEVKNLANSRDMIAQLTKKFDVSKALMNKRLSECIGWS